jgi:hypothetical protein
MTVEKTPKRRAGRPTAKKPISNAASRAASIDRWQIEREAYLRAERRGFEPGHELEDWLAAERFLGGQAIMSDRR